MEGKFYFPIYFLGEKWLYLSFRYSMTSMVLFSETRRIENVTAPTLTYVCSMFYGFVALILLPALGMNNKMSEVQVQQHLESVDYKGRPEQ